MVQLLTLLQVTGQAMPLTSIVLTEIGAVPLRVTRFELTVNRLVPLTVNGDATAASCESRNVRRWLNQVLTAVGAARTWPSQNCTPLATSALYFASMTGSQLALKRGPSTASCTARK